MGPARNGPELQKRDLLLWRDPLLVWRFATSRRVVQQAAKFAPEPRTTPARKVRPPGLPEWFAAIPEFRVKPGADTAMFAGLKSIRNLQLVWDVKK